MPKKTTGLGRGSTGKQQAIDRMNMMLPSIIAECEKGMTLIEVCNFLGLCKNSVLAWIRQGYPESHLIREAQARGRAFENARLRENAEKILAMMRTGLSARASCRALNLPEWEAHNIANGKLAPDVSEYIRSGMKEISDSPEIKMLRSLGKAQSPKGGRPTGGSVYFIQGVGGGCIKIGFTGGHPEQRRKDLQTGSPTELKIIHHVKGSRNDEAWAHHYFRNSHSHGEWFWPSRDLMEFIASGVTLSALRHEQPEQKAMTA